MDTQQRSPHVRLGGRGGSYLGVLVEKVLDGGLVHLQRVHEVLRIAPDAQLVALAELAGGGVQVACETSGSRV